MEEFAAEPLQHKIDDLGNEVILFSGRMGRVNA
jgi:hypothetical protein